MSSMPDTPSSSENGVYIGLTVASMTEMAYTLDFALHVKLLM